LSHATGGSHESGDFAKRTPAALSTADAQAMLDALRVEPLPPHPLHGAPVRDELTLFVRGADGQLRELARRVLSGG